MVLTLNYNLCIVSVLEAEFHVMFSLQTSSSADEPKGLSKLFLLSTLTEAYTIHGEVAVEVYVYLNLGSIFFIYQDNYNTATPPPPDVKSISRDSIEFD